MIEQSDAPIQFRNACGKRRRCTARHQRARLHGHGLRRADILDRARDLPLHQRGLQPIFGRGGFVGQHRIHQLCGIFQPALKLRDVGFKAHNI